MPKKKRSGFTGTGQKYPQRPIVNTRNAGVREAFYAATDADAPLDERHIAAGYLKHPASGLYQVWISTNGLDFTPLAAFREETKAGATVSLIQQEIQAGHFSNTDLVHDFYRFLEQESDGPIQLFPDDQVRKLGRDLLHSVIALPES